MARRTSRSLVSHKDSLILIRSGTTVTVPTTVADGRPFDGVSRARPSRWLFKMRADNDSTSSVVTGGKLYIWDGRSWFAYKSINAGTAVTVAVQGYMEVFNDLCMGSRIAFGATSATNGISVELDPLVEYEF